MEKDISKDMYFLYKKILKQIPKKELDDDVDTSFLEKDIISFLYKFFETNYFNYPNKRDLPHFDICNVAVQDDGNVGAQAFYSEESKTIYLDGHDIFEIAHGKRKFGDLLNSLGHEFRHFLQYRAKESDFITKTGKESYKFLETSLFGYYYQLFEEDLAMDNGLKELEKFCKKDSVKESKFAKFVSKTIKETGLYAYTIYAGQDASQLHEEDARLAGLVFCADFYNRMIRESFNRGD